MQTMKMQQNGILNKWKQLTGLTPVSVVNISPIIGANVGIGAAAVASHV